MYDPRCCRFPKSCSCGPHQSALWDAAPQMTPEQQEEPLTYVPARIVPAHFEPARAHARRTDPFTSDQALKAIAKDGTLMANIWTVARMFRQDQYPFNDTQLTEWVEHLTEHRQQRSVIARSRGLMEQAGMFRRVGVLTYEGRELVHYEIDPNNTKEQGNG